MNKPVTQSDITLLNPLATCANILADKVFKDLTNSDFIALQQPLTELSYNPKLFNRA